MAPSEPMHAQSKLLEPAGPGAPAGARSGSIPMHLPVASANPMSGIVARSLQEPFRHLVRRHPCISEEAHARIGRVHLPVSPTCNIQCRFCARGFHEHAQRPGVASALLSPADAVCRVEQAIELCPELGVVGVAGPGDSLASPHALLALRAVHERFPDLVLCLSTNGLELAEMADEIWSAGVRVLTVTVNAVSPTVLTKIVSSVRLNHRRLDSTAAAEALICAQAQGVRRAMAGGMYVKVNTVVIPGINLHHVDAIARTCSDWGARQINLIPLIPQHEFSHLRAPSCHELVLAREQARAYLPVFRHCRQCRADAIGIPGKDRVLDESTGARAERTETTFSHG